MPRIKLADFLAAIEREEEEWMKQRVAREQSALHEIQRLEPEAVHAASEIDKKVSLRQRMEDEGVSTSTVDTQIEHLRLHQESLIRVLEEARADLEANKTSGFMSSDASQVMHRHRSSTAERLGIHLSRIGCVDVEDFDSLADLWRALPVSVGESDSEGHPTRLHIKLGHRLVLSAPIVPGKWVCRAFFPAALRWMRSGERADGSSTNGPDAPIVAVVRRNGRRYAFTNRFTDFQEHSTYEEEGESLVEHDFSHLLHSLEDELEEQLREMPALDLDGEFAPDSLAAVLQDKLLKLTTTEPRFRPAAARENSPDIAERLSRHWQGFIAAPWHDGITGHLALLKYLAENGERPRFWNGPFEGHYGFRLRTRDHDWLIGELFLHDDQAAVGTAIHVIPRTFGVGVAVEFGALALRVEQSKS